MSDYSSIPMLLERMFSNPYFAISYSIYIAIVKGFSLWKSAKNDSRYWFIFLLVINLFGIPELLYIFYFSTHPVKLPSVKSSALLSKITKNKK